VAFYNTIYYLLKSKAATENKLKRTGNEEIKKVSKESRDCLKKKWMSLSIILSLSKQDSSLKCILDSNKYTKSKTNQHI
jgi:hypothetical protein